MRVLFIHRNGPAQFRHLIGALCAEPSNDVWMVAGEAGASRAKAAHARLNIASYIEPRAPAGQAGVHPWLSGLELQVRRGQVVADVMRGFIARGIAFDVIVAHPGWGEALFIKDIFPNTPLLAYFEFFYSASGADVGFDPEFSGRPGDGERLRVRNMLHLSALNACDAGLTPTQWQLSRLPREYRGRVAVIHEGVDIAAVKPQADACLEWQGHTFRAGEPIVTYVARNLEPYRGFHIFMRSLPALLAARPDVHVLIVGGDEVSYGAASRHPGGWQGQLSEELARAGSPLDPGRVHFLGRLPYRDYLRVLQVSAAHVYLTYPFVLSWSMLEAMAAGCVVIGSDTSPVTEILMDRVNGRLVDFFDQEQLVGVILAVLADPDGNHALRARARATVAAKFDLRRQCLPAALQLVRSLGEGPSMESTILASRKT